MVTVKLLPHFMKDDSAASAVEYALLIGALSAVISAVLHSLGIALDGTFLRISTSIHEGIVFDGSP